MPTPGSGSREGAVQTGQAEMIFNRNQVSCTAGVAAGGRRSYRVQRLLEVVPQVEQRRARLPENSKAPRRDAYDPAGATSPLRPGQRRVREYDVLGSGIHVPHCSG